MLRMRSQNKPAASFTCRKEVPNLAFGFIAKLEPSLYIILKKV